MNRRPNAVVQIVFFYVGWLLSIATVVPIPFMAALTIWWLARSYKRRAEERALVRGHLEQRNMLEVGTFFGGR